MKYLLVLFLLCSFGTYAGNDLDEKTVKICKSFDHQHAESLAWYTSYSILAKSLKPNSEFATRVVSIKNHYKSISEDIEKLYTSFNCSKALHK